MFTKDLLEMAEAWEKEHPYLLIEKIISTFDGIVIYTTVPGKTYRWDHKVKAFTELGDWRKHNA